MSTYGISHVAAIIDGEDNPQIPDCFTIPSWHVAITATNSKEIVRTQSLPGSFTSSVLPSWVYTTCTRPSLPLLFTSTLWLSLFPPLMFTDKLAKQGLLLPTGFQDQYTNLFFSLWPVDDLPSPLTEQFWCRQDPGIAPWSLPTQHLFSLLFEYKQNAFVIVYLPSPIFKPPLLLCPLLFVEMVIIVLGHLTRCFKSLCGYYIVSALRDQSVRGAIRRWDSGGIGVGIRMRWVNRSDTSHQEIVYV